jgi:protein phosphatase
LISSDFCRGLVADDENDQSATPDAFEVLRFIAGKRLAAAASPSSTPPTCSPKP